MKFSNLLADAIGQSEIPLRFEPGAEEAVARPVIGFLKEWITAHDPDPAKSDFEYGQKALILQLMEELDDKADLPVGDAA